MAMTAPMAAQATAEAAPEAGEIVVTGQREGTLNLKRLRAAIAAFQEGRDRYAPGSTLGLQLRPAGGKAGDVRLTLRNGTREVAVPVDADGHFAIPAVAGDGWTLVHNRGRARMGLRAVVLSPGAVEADRPLGDLRLQCRVGWEAMKDAFNFMQRGAFQALGGCEGGRVHIYFGAMRPLAAATVDGPAGRVPMEVRTDGGSYRAPLGDRTLPNAARVRLTYRTPA